MTTGRSFNGFTVLADYPPSSGEFCAPGMKMVYTRNRATAVLFEAMARRWEEEVEPIARSHPDNRFKPRERHSYTKSGVYDRIGIHCYRPPGTKVGTGDESNHRSATAIDINGHLHPYEATTSGTYRDGFTQAQRDKVREIARDIRDGSGVTIGRAGLDFARGKRDGMHLEIGPGVTMTQVRSAARRWEAFVGRSSTAAVWFKDARGYDVKATQADLAQLDYTVGSADGYAGSLTDAALRRFQRDEGLKDDGRFGPATRAALDYRLSNPKQPEPAPVEEVPDMSEYRIAGADRYETLALSAIESGHTTIYLVGSQIDAVAAAVQGDGAVMLVQDGRDELPSSVEAALKSIKPTEVVAYGGAIRVTDKALFTARKLAGLA